MTAYNIVLQIILPMNFNFSLLAFKEKLFLTFGLSTRAVRSKHLIVTEDQNPFRMIYSISK